MFGFAELRHTCCHTGRTIYTYTPGNVFRGRLPRSGAVWEQSMKTQTNNQTSQKDNEQNKKHTNIQTKKRSIKQTIRQAHHQTNQKNNKEKTRKKPKQETLHKKYATPDRPPPAAAMLTQISIVIT